MIRKYLLSIAVATTVSMASAQQSSQNLVLDLERYLSQLGFNPGTVDGVVDANTNTAIAAYQSARGLIVTGGMDITQFQALEREAKSAASAQTATPQAPPAVSAYRPIQGDPFLDFRVPQCAGTPGFGLLVYGTIAEALRLSDLCIIEQEGTVIAAETVQNLTLTKNSVQGRAYEDLTTGKREYQRNSISFSPDTIAENCAPETESLEYIIVDRSITGVSGVNFATIRGYTTPVTYALPAKPQAKIRLGIRDVTQGELGTKTIPLGVTNAQGDMLGQANFSGDQGQMLISEGGGHTYGDVTGNLNFKFTGDGSFLAAGQFSAKSIRIAGHQPQEMVSISGTIPYIRGHILGKAGSQLLGYGLFTGTYLDASGKQHQVRASVYITSCITG